MAVASRPFLPVKALALPELTTSTRAVPPPRFCRQKSTGADGHFERVKTPATAVPGSNTMASRSVRFRYLMPASAVAIRTPSTAGMRGYFFGASGEICADIRSLERICGRTPVCPIGAMRARGGGRRYLAGASISPCTLGRRRNDVGLATQAPARLLLPVALGGFHCLLQGLVRNLDLCGRPGLPDHREIPVADDGRSRLLLHLLEGWWLLRALVVNLYDMPSKLRLHGLLGVGA